MQAWFASEETIAFVSDEARAAWRERMQMLRDAIELKKPKRVPMVPNGGLFPALYAGVTARETYYDLAKVEEAWMRVNADFDYDAAYSTFAVAIPGELHDILDMKLINWAGHGTADENMHFQYNEREWMHADEYDLLIRDPSDFWQRVYLPRIFGALEPWTALSPFTSIRGATSNEIKLFPFSTPPVQHMLDTLVKAGEAGAKWMKGLSRIDAKAEATFGRPQTFGGAFMAPYDTIGDTLRGTRGVMLDKFRQPGKLLAAVELLAPLAVEEARRGADASKRPIVFVPLHKGADTFLSDADFRKFYWPSLKAVLLGLINEGLVVWLFAEGGYNSRLEAIHDLDIPAGRLIWAFDTTDMKEAKRHLGGYQCIAGNVPGSLLIAGTPAEVDEYVKQLIADVAGGGGFLLSPGICVNEAKPECMQAMLDAGKKYGAAILT